VPVPVPVAAVAAAAAAAAAVVANLTTQNAVGPGRKMCFLNLAPWVRTPISLLMVMS